jgi:hypothetical protein
MAATVSGLATPPSITPQAGLTYDFTLTRRGVDDIEAGCGARSSRSERRRQPFAIGWSRPQHIDTLN